MPKKIFILITVTSIFFNFILFYERQNYPLAGDLEVTILDIGQGDSILIKTPDNNYGLIDTGRGSKVVEELSNILPFFTKTFDFIVLTHPDADHVEGFLSLLAKYKFKNIFIEKVPKDTSIFANIIAKLKTLDAKIYSITKDNDFVLDGITFDVLWPESLDLTKYKDDVNETSISIMLSYKDFTMFSAGDLPSQDELAAMNNIANKSIDVLKVGHHGSKYSTSDEFLTESKPKIAAISVAKNNSYGHPNAQVIDELKAANVNIYRTDQDGRILIKTNGENIEVSTQNGKSLTLSAQ